MFFLLSLVTFLAESKEVRLMFVINQLAAGEIVVEYFPMYSLEN